MEDVSHAVCEFAAVSDFMAARSIAWAPPVDWLQHNSDDMRQYLEEARTAFSDSPAVLGGLKAYEGDVSDLLEDQTRRNC
jgi:hypothetical protein